MCRMIQKQERERESTGLIRVNSIMSLSHDGQIKAANKNRSSEHASQRGFSKETQPNSQIFDNTLH